MEELAGASVLVLGLGVSGRSAAAFCAARGAQVCAADERPAEQIEGAAQWPAGVEVRVGRPFPNVADFDLVVPSPGVPPARYRPGARRVWGDVELAFRTLRVPVVAVTGTNGKSTTTCLVEAGLRGAGLRARAAGNLGESALSLVGEALDVAVLEVSSFQLEATEIFAPRVAVVLNLSPDHLDRHGSFAAYAAAKARILAQQTIDDHAVLNFGDPAVRGLARDAVAQVVPFARTGPLEEGAWLDMGRVCLRERAGVRTVALEGLRLAGDHNRENALAALAAIWAFGADPEKAALGLADFAGLPHRMQEVGRVGDVVYVDDSKATNPGAAASALEGTDARVVWLAGGRNKGLDFSGLAAAAAPRVRAAVLFGEAAVALEEALSGTLPCHVAGDLDAAVRRAAELARPGDVVLLAPACASQDAFRDYAERGERFRDAVSRLSHAPAGDSR